MKEKDRHHPVKIWYRSNDNPAEWAAVGVYDASGEVDAIGINQGNADPGRIKTTAELLLRTDVIRFATVLSVKVDRFPRSTDNSLFSSKASASCFVISVS